MGAAAAPPPEEQTPTVEDWSERDQKLVVRTVPGSNCLADLVLRAKVRGRARCRRRRRRGAPPCGTRPLQQAAAAAVPRLPPALQPGHRAGARMRWPAARLPAADAWAPACACARRMRRPRMHAAAGGRHAG
jgi:hypothetical protein